jgi:predicted hydrocarbon binding protein
LTYTERVPVKKPVGNSSRDMQSLPSKTAFVAELVPNNRKLVEFSIELANNPGAIVAVASILSKHKVNILTGFHDVEEWSFFADVTEIESSIDDIAKEISSLPIVSNVSLSKEVSEGIIVDSLHQQFKWGPFRSIIIRAEVMSSILNRIKGIFGPEGKAGKAIVFGMGEAAGQDFYKGLANHMSSEIIKSHVGDVVGLLMADGWGDFRLTSLDLNGMTASVTLLNGFECAHEPGSSSSPSTCDFIRGHIAGVLSERFGKRMDVTETLCVSRGHSHCQFDVSGVKQ